MRRTIAAALFPLAGLAPAQAAEGGQLDLSPALFSVLAAINIAGDDAAVDSPHNGPLRALVRNHLAANPPACLPELKRFFNSAMPGRPHRLRSCRTKNSVISCARSIGPPPSPG